MKSTKQIRDVLFKNNIVSQFYISLSKKLCSLIIRIFIITSLSGILFAQSSEPELDQIGLEQGLSQSTVFAIVQDTQGFMWFGTQDGLNRYDGYSIKIFRHNPSDSNSIAGNNIRSLLCDRDGDLWIGTQDNGLDRFVVKQKRFIHYNHNNNISTTLSNNFVTSLFEDSRRNIWVGTSKGLNLFDKLTGKFIYPNCGKDSQRINNATVSQICEDTKGNLWVATSNGLFKLNLDDLITGTDIPHHLLYLNSPSDTNSLSNNNVHTVYIDNEGILWVGTYGGGLNRLNENTNRFIRYRHDPKNSNSLFSNFISSIHEDSKRNLWIATYDAGLLKYNYLTNSFDQYIGESLWSLYEDRSGLLWIGTYFSGVKILNSHKNMFRRLYYYNFSNTKKSSAHMMVMAILQDKDGDVWLGTYGNGLIRIEDKTHKIYKYTPDPKNKNAISSNNIFCLSEASDGNIWIGTDGGGLNCFNKKTNSFDHYFHDAKNNNSILVNRITSEYYDVQSKTLWVSYLTNGISKYEFSKKQFTHYIYNANDPKTFAGSRVTVIYKSPKSGLLVGTQKDGIYHFIPANNSFENVKIGRDQNSGINEHGIHSLYEDISGILWIGTDGYGLIQYNPKTELTITFTVEDGLPNNVIYGVLPDKEGSLWLSTNNGLSRFSPVTKRFRNYDVYDGLQSNEFNDAAYFQSSDGVMYFGGINGFNAFHPEEIKDNKYIPPVYLTTFKVFNEVLPLSNPIPNNTKIELTYAQNYFSLEFVALNYTAPEKNQYAYMLKGFDKDWHKVSALQRFASYTNLDPGEYILHVKASNNDGLWNETGASITIVVTPPFWKTWWFQTIAIILILVSIWGTIRYFIMKKVKKRIRKIEQETMLERERLRISRNMHDDLGSRLTEIRLLSEMAQNDSDKKAVVTLRDISEVARSTISTLSEMIWSVNPQNDTVENLSEYIGEYAAEYLSKVNIICRLNLPYEFPILRTPSEIRQNVLFAVKEALNNAVKHSDTNEIHLGISFEGYTFIIIINDFGKGFTLNKIEHNGNGLQNMKKRLEQIGGGFEMKSGIGLGTTIKFTIPLSGVD